MDFTVGGDLMLRLDEASNKVNIPQSEFMVSASYGWFKNSMGGSTDNVEVIRLGAMVDSPNNPLAKFFVDDAQDRLEYNILRYHGKHTFTRGSAAGGHVRMAQIFGDSHTKLEMYHQSNVASATGSLAIQLFASTGSSHQSFIKTGGGLLIQTGSLEVHSNISGSITSTGSLGHLAVGGKTYTHQATITSAGNTNSVVRIDADDGRGASRYALDIVDDDSNSRGSVRISTTSGPSIIANSNISSSITSTGSFGRVHTPGTIKSDSRIEIGSNCNFLTTQLKVGDGTRDIRLNANHGSQAVVGTVGAHDFSIITGNTIRATIDGSDGGVQISGSILPFADNVVDLGSSSKRWNDVFAVQTTVGAVFETGLRSKGIGKEETGTIVVWRNGGLVPCDKSEDTMVMGVTKKGKDEPIVMGAEPVLVTGDVKEGDFITTSTKQGHGKKLENGYLLKKEMFGKVIAQALEDSSGESSLIKCMIRKM